MCTIIDFATRDRREAPPSFRQFIEAKVEGPIRVADDYDPDWPGETVTLYGFFEFAREFQALFGVPAWA